MLHLKSVEHGHIGSSTNNDDLWESCDDVLNSTAFWSSCSESEI